MSHSENDSRVLAIESNSIGHVPAEHRHGKPSDLFTLWFCTNIAPLAVITGATSMLVFNLDLVSAIFAIVAGHFFGAIFLALTSAQGPQVGIPQMIQSRAQFGRYGSLLVVCFTTIIYLGFFVSNIILSGKTLHAVAPVLPESTATVLGAILATLVGVIGYNFIHQFNKIGTWFMGSALLIGMVIMVPDLDAQVLQRGEFTLSNWFAMFGLCAVWQISFSPYTSDYSRYLPSSVGIAKPFAYTYFGAAVGTVFAFIFGVVAVSAGGFDDAMQAVQTRTGMFGYALIVLFLINIIGHNGMNLYGAVLSFITAIQTFRHDWIPGKGVRIFTSISLLIAATITALWASSNFIQIFLNAIFTMLVVLVPWVAINLIDFYLVNNKQYQVLDILKKDGGIYGTFNTKAISIYAVGIAIQIPFLRSAFYQGPWAHVLGEADVSWLIGLSVTAVLYYVLAVGKKTSHQGVAGKGIHAQK